MALQKQSARFFEEPANFAPQWEGRREGVFYDKGDESSGVFLWYLSARSDTSVSEYTENTYTRATEEGDIKLRCHVPGSLGEARTVTRKSSTGELCVCAGGLTFVQRGLDVQI